FIGLAGSIPLRYAVSGAGFLRGCIQLAESDTHTPAATLSDGAFQRLQKAIVEGEIAPGSRISEQFVSSTYGISRGPLREAIRRHRLLRGRMGLCGACRMP